MSNTENSGIGNLKQLQKELSEGISFSEARLLEMARDVRSSLLGLLKSKTPEHPAFIGGMPIESVVELDPIRERNKKSIVKPFPETDFDQSKQETRSGYNLSYKINITDKSSVFVNVRYSVPSVRFKSDKDVDVVVGNKVMQLKDSPKNMVRIAEAIYDESVIMLSK